MLVGNWSYKINSNKALDGYKTVEKHFSKHGVIGSAIQNHHGTRTGSYTTFIGYENHEHFGDIDDKISNDENFAKDMEPYFEMTSWESMNFYRPLMHEMEPDPGIKHCFAQWNFKHNDEELLLKESESFFKYWMGAGANGCSVGWINGTNLFTYGFGVRFQSMKDYGKAQDKLNDEKVFANHSNFLNECEWIGFDLSRVLDSNWD